MIKYLTTFLLFVALSGCESGTVSQDERQLNWKIHCIDGVEYLFRASGYNGFLSVKFDRDGNVSLCEG